MDGRDEMNCTIARDVVNIMQDDQKPCVTCQKYVESFLELETKKS